MRQNFYDFLQCFIERPSKTIFLKDEQILEEDSRCTEYLKVILDSLVIKLKRASMWIFECRYCPKTIRRVAKVFGKDWWCLGNVDAENVAALGIFTAADRGLLSQTIITSATWLLSIVDKLKYVRIGNTFHPKPAASVTYATGTVSAGDGVMGKRSINTNHLLIRLLATPYSIYVL